MNRVSASSLLSLASGLLALACSAELSSPEPIAIGTHSQAVTIPARGSASTLDLGEWNVEWFGDSSNGPSNESLQLSNVRDVIAGADLDIWGLEEVVSQSQFNSLKAQLTGYTGFTASESVVSQGSSYYAASEQKPAILYKSSVASLVSARLILTANDSDFAGRPPMEVKLHVTLNGTSDDLIVIVLHMKAFNDTTSWQRRQNASSALKSYLDSTYPTQKVVVLGDYNDDVDTSITAGKPSPYANFVADTARYRFPTKELSDAGIATTVGYADAIDHHLCTDEFHALYQAGSADVYRVDEYISSYGTTTSDHYPTLTQYSWSTGGGNGGGGGSASLMLNEICANEPGSNTAGEFIEIVNVGAGSADLSGYSLRDGTAARHTFASGTSLAAGKALVVFAGSSAIPSGLSNAVAASTGVLSLGNGGDTVTLEDASGTTLDTFTYGSSLANVDGVSMNRSPDASATGSFVLHTAISSLGASPGVRANGNAF